MRVSVAAVLLVLVSAMLVDARPQRDELMHQVRSKFDPTYDAFDGNCSYAGFDLNGVAAQDISGSDGGQYSYTMRACGATSDPQCRDTTGLGFGGSVCQYTPSSKQYVHMLGSWYGPVAPVWSQLNFSEGVSVLISNGDACTAFGQVVPRTVVIDFVCAASTDTSFTVITSPVNPCAYQITMPVMMLACNQQPLSCRPIVNGHKWDLGGLMSRQWAITTRGYTYQLFVCGVSTDSACVAVQPDGSTLAGSMCQYSGTGGKYMHALAAYHPGVGNWTISSSGYLQQIILNGDMCFSLGVMHPRATIVTYVSGTYSRIWDVTQPSTDPCRYDVTFYTPYANPITTADDEHDDAKPQHDDDDHE